jgi:membrane protease YdiL (CAAX protease family)
VPVEVWNARNGATEDGICKRGGFMRAISDRGTADHTASVTEAFAPWWHSLLVLAGVAGLSVASAHEHGIPNLHIPELNPRLSSYFTVILAEWSLVLIIWVPLKQRGRTLGTVVSGRWNSPLAFFRDIGLAIAFFAVVTIPLSLVINRLAPNVPDPATLMLLPKTVSELAVWLAMSVTGGFCEELVFRGYLAQQFGAWTGSRSLGVVAQAICFGVAHAQYSKGVMIGVAFLGLFLGLLCQWRKSLRPAMLVHGIQDALSGIEGFLSYR